MDAVVSARFGLGILIFKYLSLPSPGLGFWAYWIVPVNVWYCMRKGGTNSCDISCYWRRQLLSTTSYRLPLARWTSRKADSLALGCKLFSEGWTVGRNIWSWISSKSWERREPVSVQHKMFPLSLPLTRGDELGDFRGQIPYDDLWPTKMKFPWHIVTYSTSSGAKWTDRNVVSNAYEMDWLPWTHATRDYISRNHIKSTIWYYIFNIMYDRMNRDIFNGHKKYYYFTSTVTTPAISWYQHDT